MTETTIIRTAHTREHGVHLRMKNQDILDFPPEFCFIPKGQLAIDRSYQRGLSEQRVRAIASSWSWVACGALKVSLRPDGEWYVFDGQHRLEAAMRIKDIIELPCLVYEMKSKVSEAKGYLSQTAASPMRASDRFRALVIAGDPNAIMIKELADASGVVIRSGVKAGERAMGCAAELLYQASNNPDILRRIWPIFVSFLDRGSLVNDRMVRGLIMIEMNIDDESLTNRKWFLRLSHVSSADLIENITRSCAMEGGASARSCANGILGVLNRGLRNRLIVKGVNG